MTLQSWLTAYWQPLLIGAVLGLILGWLIFGLRSRGRQRSLEASLQDAQSKLASTEKALSDAKQQAQTAQANLSAADANLAQARNQLVAWQTSYQTMQDEKLATESQIKQGDERYTALQQEQEVLRATLEGTALDLSKARQDLEAAAETITNKDTALNEAYVRAVRLQRDLTDQQQMLAATQTELATLKREVSLLGASNQDLDKKLHNARGEVAGELAVLTSTMLKVKDDALAHANATIALLTAQLEEMRATKTAVG